LFFPHRERELRRRYEQAFGRDKYLKAPELFGALAIAVFAISAVSRWCLRHDRSKSPDYSYRVGLFRAGKPTAFAIHD
jgi:hypothetical protein